MSRVPAPRAPSPRAPSPRAPSPGAPPPGAPSPRAAAPAPVALAGTRVVDDVLDAVRPRKVVLVILAYVVALGALRLSLSPFLEIDEAQFVGATDLRLTYGNSHPPLYNGLVRGALELASGDFAAAVTMVRVLLLAGTHLLVFDAGRRIAGVGGGLVALAAAALMPQISWMSAHTLAHSLLVMAGAAGVLHALVLIVQRPTAAAFAWAGLAAALGGLGKFNLGLMVGPLAVAILLEPTLRARFARPAALLAPLVFALVAGPALVAAALQPEESTERLFKLFEEGPFTFLDVPGVGLDGLLSLILSAAASAGLPLAAIALFGRGGDALPPDAEALRRVLWRTLWLGLGGFAVVALVTDLSLVHERYLTPLLMVVPPLAALHLSGWLRRRWFVLVGMVAFGAVPLGIAGMVTFDDHRFARPYDILAGSFVQQLPPGPVSVASTRQDLAANIVLALRQRNVAAYVEGDPTAPPALAFVRVRGARDWGGDQPAPPPGYCPASSTSADVPLNNVSGKRMGFSALVAIACDGG